MNSPEFEGSSERISRRVNCSPVLLAMASRTPVAQPTHQAWVAERIWPRQSNHTARTHDLLGVPFEWVPAKGLLLHANSTCLSFGESHPIPFGAHFGSIWGPF